MKKNIHPTIHPAIFIDTSCGKEFFATSTLTSDETREVNGVPHYMHRIEISSASHPFYTGKQILVDTARRAEKFQERAAKVQATKEIRKGKKAKRVKAQAKKTALQAKKEKKTAVEAEKK